MAKVRVEVNQNALYDVRRSPAVIADLERRAAAIAEACNREAHTEQFKTSSRQGRRRSRDGGRWRTTVITAGAGAIKHNAAHNTLVRNMEAGRG